MKLLFSFYSNNNKTSSPQEIKTIDQELSSKIKDVIMLPTIISVTYQYDQTFSLQHKGSIFQCENKSKRTVRKLY